MDTVYRDSQKFKKIPFQKKSFFFSVRTAAKAHLLGRNWDKTLRGPRRLQKWQKYLWQSLHHSKTYHKKRSQFNLGRMEVETQMKTSIFRLTRVWVARTMSLALVAWAHFSLVISKNPQWKSTSSRWLKNRSRQLVRSRLSPRAKQVWSITHLFCWLFSF